MTTSNLNLKGPYEELLKELADLIDELWKTHGMSFVKAGDDRVYAFGGDGYIVVLDESKWEGLIEFITPKGTLSIKPDETGRIGVVSSLPDEKATKELLKDGIKGLSGYYEKRYWSTPVLA